MHNERVWEMKAFYIGAFKRYRRIENDINVHCVEAGINVRKYNYDDCSRIRVNDPILILIL